MINMWRIFRYVQLVTKNRKEVRKKDFSDTIGFMDERNFSLIIVAKLV